MDSEPGLGSTFSVYLPLDKPSRSKKSPRSTRTAHSDRKARIVVLDDEELLASAVSELLTSAGHTVTTFTHPVHAIDHLSTDPSIDVLITDLAMPQLDGFEVADKALLITPNLPIILLSGNLPLLKAEDNGRLKLFAASLKKPFTPAELLRTVKGILARNPSQQARAPKAP